MLIVINVSRTAKFSHQIPLLPKLLKYAVLLFFFVALANVCLWIIAFTYIQTMVLNVLHTLGMERGFSVYRSRKPYKSAQYNEKKGKENKKKKKSPKSRLT